MLTPSSTATALRESPLSFQRSIRFVQISRADTDIATSGRSPKRTSRLRQEGDSSNAVYTQVVLRTTEHLFGLRLDSIPAFLAQVLTTARRASEQDYPRPHADASQTATTER